MESGRVRNISSSGALLTLKAALDVGSRVEIYIRLPMEKTNWMKYSGRVSRSDWLGAELITAVRFDGSRPEFHAEAGE
jgi:CYTH domain-containing protein